MEIADKLRKIFHSIPESFLPYSEEILEEALNITAKNYFDAGDKKMANTIQETMAGFLWCHKKDEEAVKDMKRGLDLMLKDPELKKVKLEKLRECRDSWVKLRNKK